MNRFDANDAVFAFGLLLVALSLAQWSVPLAGVVLGVVLMTASVWPLLRSRNE